VSTGSDIRFESAVQKAEAFLERFWTPRTRAGRQSRKLLARRIAAGMFAVSHLPGGRSLWVSLAAHSALVAILAMVVLFPKTFVLPEAIQATFAPFFQEDAGGGGGGGLPGDPAPETPSTPDFSPGVATPTVLDPAILTAAATPSFQLPAPGAPVASPSTLAALSKIHGGGGSGTGSGTGDGSGVGPGSGSGTGGGSGSGVGKGSGSGIGSGKGPKAIGPFARGKDPFVGQRVVVLLDVSGSMIGRDGSGSALFNFADLMMRYGCSVEIIPHSDALLEEFGSAGVPEIIQEHFASLGYDVDPKEGALGALKQATKLNPDVIIYMGDFNTSYIMLADSPNRYTFVDIARLSGAHPRCLQRGDGSIEWFSDRTREPGNAPQEQRETSRERGHAGRSGCRQTDHQCQQAGALGADRNQTCQHPSARLGCRGTGPAA